MGTYQTLDKKNKSKKVNLSNDQIDNISTQKNNEFKQFLNVIPISILLL